VEAQRIIRTVQRQAYREFRAKHRMDSMFTVSKPIFLLLAVTLLGVSPEKEANTAIQ
jgi:hypothetical protein